MKIKHLSTYESVNTEQLPTDYIYKASNQFRGKF